MRLRGVKVSLCNIKMSKIRSNHKEVLNLIQQDKLNVKTLDEFEK